MVDYSAAAPVGLNFDRYNVSDSGRNESHLSPAAIRLYVRENAPLTVKQQTGNVHLIMDYGMQQEFVSCLYGNMLKSIWIPSNSETCLIVYLALLQKVLTGSLSKVPHCSVPKHGGDSEFVLLRQAIIQLNDDEVDD